ncbi:hypothetical protein ERO13_D13G143700v2 [Gossypium hirsutum]|uniref:Pollen Ole e 1 allergen and extensin family protein n=1 Tax=Gossypium hirsutum TaxID=3635 RepID=A0A1U8KTZ6_GOSHI|nr:uncharacterized protein LOC107919199 [Gossypium hirsutum]KAG4112123.1 hypothetical protein ERO13_D13G143700v2 [Gossypium hirsutum]
MGSVSVLSPKKEGFSFPKSQMVDLCISFVTGLLLAQLNVSDKDKTHPMESKNNNLVLGFVVLAVFLISGVKSWTGEIHGRVVCDVCADSSIGPEDHVLEGAEVAVLCITKSGEVVNYPAFTNSKGIYTVAETMPESEWWDACLARPISSFHDNCNHLGDGSTGIKFTYNHPSGHFHVIRPFVYRPSTAPTYCI